MTNIFSGLQSPRPLLRLLLRPLMLALVAASLAGCGDDSDPGVGVIGTSLVAVSGQSLCYDSVGTTINCAGTGQDADELAGVVWPATRFSLNVDNTISDALTGLAWAQDANLMPSEDPGWDTDATTNDGLVSWQHALDYIAKLNSDMYLGHTDWRLPNRNELLSLAHYGQGNLATWLNAPAQGFTNVAASVYWSSTSLHSLPASVWAMNLLDGYLLALGKADAFYVWPVRDAGLSTPTLRLARTGQTRCYNEGGSLISCANTGQDGDLRKGVLWFASRFTSQADTSKEDKLTKLIWAPDANLMLSRDASFDNAGAQDGYVSWQRALDYIAKLNSDMYLGYTDWRLPNAREMQSLQHAGDDTTSWLSTNGFTGVQLEYWTSTTRTATPSSAWFMSLMINMSAMTKIASYPVWPVRGGS